MKKDIVIVGAGVVGLAAAASLASLDLDIAVLDANPITPIKESLDMEPDLRVYAFNQASKMLFQSFGAWELLAEKNLLSPYRHMQVWDANSKGVLSFNAQELGLQQLGHIVEERSLKQVLLSTIEKLDNVSLHGECSLKSISVQEDAVFLQTSTEDISAKLVVGADGANSWLRKTLDFTCQETPYPHHVIVCYVQTEKSHQQTAFQLFHHEGPLAFLPLRNAHQCSIVWSMPKAQAKERQKERDKKRKPAVRKPAVRKYKKKEAPKPMTFTRLKKPITLSFD